MLIFLPSMVTVSDGETFVPGSVIDLPFTVTFPSLTSSAASLREQRPQWAIYLLRGIEVVPGVLWVKPVSFDVCAWGLRICLFASNRFSIARCLSFFADLFSCLISSFTALFLFLLKNLLKLSVFLFIIAVLQQCSKSIELKGKSRTFCAALYQ